MRLFDSTLEIAEVFLVTHESLVSGQVAQVPGQVIDDQGRLTSDAGGNILIKI